MPNQRCQGTEYTNTNKDLNIVARVKVISYTHEFDMCRVKPGKPRVVFQRRNYRHKLPAMAHHTATLATNVSSVNINAILYTN